MCDIHSKLKQSMNFTLVTYNEDAFIEQIYYFKATSWEHKEKEKLDFFFAWTLFKAAYLLYFFGLTDQNTKYRSNLSVSSCGFILGLKEPLFY